MDVFVKQQRSALFMAIRSASVAQITQLLLRRYKTPFPSFKSTGTTKATDPILTQYRLLHLNDPTCAKKESRLWKNLRSVIFRMIITRFSLVEPLRLTLSTFSRVEIGSYMRYRKVEKGWLHRTMNLDIPFFDVTWLKMRQKKKIAWFLLRNKFLHNSQKQDNLF